MNGNVRWIVLFSLLLVLATATSLCLGVQNFTPLEVIRYLADDYDHEVRAERSAAAILRDIRLPRILLALTIGFGLASAGTGYQGLFRNPLADPFIIGASSGAALGVAVAITQDWRWQILELGPVFLFALLGGLLAVGLVYVIATSHGRAPMTELLLAGVAVSSFFGASVSLVMYQNQDNIIRIIQWLMGSLSTKGWPEVQIALPMVMYGAGLTWVCSRGLDALTFGEESASSLGVNLRLLRAAVVLGASVTTAASVAAGGVIAFVGLIAPHVARLIVGARHAALLPASCLIGALMLLIADGVARTVVAPEELPPGVVTAFLGGPFFLYLLKSRSHNLESMG